MKDSLPIIVALIALIGALFGAVVSLLAARRSTYINSVTVERSKWIGELRANLANLASHVMSMNRSLLDDQDFLHSDRYRSIEQEIYRLSALIRLQLNPSNEIDANLLRILDQFTDSFNNPTDFKWAGHEFLLVSHAQWLLKAEWEKVKAEAAGLPFKAWYWLKAKRHMSRYREYSDPKNGFGRLG